MKNPLACLLQLTNGSSTHNAKTPTCVQNDDKVAYSVYLEKKTINCSFFFKAIHYINI